MRGPRELWPSTFEQWKYDEVRAARRNFWNALESGDTIRIKVAANIMLWQAENCITMENTPPTDCDFEEAKEITYAWLKYIIGIDKIK